MDARKEGIFVRYMYAASNAEGNKPFIQILEAYKNRPFDHMNDTFEKMMIPDKDEFMNLFNSHVHEFEVFENLQAIAFPMEIEIFQEVTNKLEAKLIELVDQLRVELTAKLASEKANDASNLVMIISKGYAFHLLSCVQRNLINTDNELFLNYQQYHLQLQKAIFSDNVVESIKHNLRKLFSEPTRFNISNVSKYERVFGDIFEQIYFDAVSANVEKIQPRELAGVKETLSVLRNEEVKLKLSELLGVTTPERHSHDSDSPSRLNRGRSTSPRTNQGIFSRTGRAVSNVFSSVGVKHK